MLLIPISLETKFDTNFSQSFGEDKESKNKRMRGRTRGKLEESVTELQKSRNQFRNDIIYRFYLVIKMLVSETPTYFDLLVCNMYHIHLSENILLLRYTCIVPVLAWVYLALCQGVTGYCRCYIHLLFLLIPALIVCPSARPLPTIPPSS